MCRVRCARARAVFDALEAFPNLVYTDDYSNPRFLILSWLGGEARLQRSMLCFETCLKGNADAKSSRVCVRVTRLTWFGFCKVVR
jgi:hypothetical protein